MSVIVLPNAPATRPCPDRSARWGGSLLLWPSIGACALLIALWATHADVRVADTLFAWQGHAWALRHGFWTERVLHAGGRNLNAVLALALAAAWVKGMCQARAPHWLRPVGATLCAVIAANLAVAWLKSTSGVECPWDLTRYGGTHAFVGWFDHRGPGSAHGRCFPAGHAGSGYAWMAFYFLMGSISPRLRYWGLAFGLATGAIFGIGQQLRGAHFLSHDVAAATVSWVIVSIVYRLIVRESPGIAGEPR